MMRKKVREYLSRLAARHGLQIETAAVGTTAMTVTEENNFDLVR
jgi:DNA-binding response OmpR family regulator